MWHRLVAVVPGPWCCGRGGCWLQGHAAANAPGHSQGWEGCLEAAALSLQHTVCLSHRGTAGSGMAHIMAWHCHVLFLWRQEGWWCWVTPWLQTHSTGDRGERVRPLLGWQRPKNKASCPRMWPPPIGASWSLISFYGCRWAEYPPCPR